MSGDIDSIANRNAQLDDNVKKEVWSLVMGLRQNSPIRRIAEMVLQGFPLNGDEAETLLIVLTEAWDRRWKERAVAAWLLGEGVLSAEQKVQAAALLSKILEDRQVNRGHRLLGRCGRAGGRLLMLACFMGGCIALINYISDTQLAWLWWPIMLILYLLFCVLCVLCFVIPSLSFSEDTKGTIRVREMAAHTLGRLELPESIGVIAGVYTHSDCRLRWFAGRSLWNLLPLLRPDDYGKLHQQTVPHLCKSLEFYSNIEPACLTLLSALEKIGDGRAIRVVVWVRVNSAFSTVREAAGKILPILYERQRQEAEPHMLLRATQAPNTPGELLLRPSLEAGEDSAELLLRASQSE